MDGLKKFANIVALLVLIEFLSCLQASVHARNPFPETAPAQPGAGPVVVDGNMMFVLRNTPGALNLNARVRSINDKLLRLEQDPKFDPGTLSTSDTGTSTEILGGDVVIMSVTGADANAEKEDRNKLAQRYCDQLRAALQAHKNKQAVQGALAAASPEQIRESLLSILFQPLTVRIFIFIAGFGIISLTANIIRHSFDRYVAGSTKRYAINRLISFMSYFSVALFAGMVFWETLGSLAVVLGAMAAGVAVALQELIISFAGWVGITFGDYLKIGDRVQLGGIKGDVIDVGLVRTTLMEIGEWTGSDLYTGRVVRISNSFVFKQPLFNYSGDFSFLWDEILVPIKYASDLKFVKSTLQKIADEETVQYAQSAGQQWERFSNKYLVAKVDIHPQVTMELNENWMAVTVRYMVDYRQRRTIKDQISSRIMEAAQGSQGKFVPAGQAS